jgi:hypothetical protein
MGANDASRAPEGLASGFHDFPCIIERRGLTSLGKNYPSVAFPSGQPDKVSLYQHFYNDPEMVLENPTIIKNICKLNYSKLSLFCRSPSNQCVDIPTVRVQTQELLAQESGLRFA